jgi:hypothetical protein
LKGAIKNNIFERINTQTPNKISLSLFAKYNQPNATIKLYQIRVYGVSDVHQTSNGFIKANKNENNSSVLDL